MRDEFDTNKRIDIAHRFQEIIHREQPYTFFRSSEGIFAWRNKASGQAESLQGVVRWSWIITTHFMRPRKWQWFMVP